MGVAGFPARDTPFCLDKLPEIHVIKKKKISQIKMKNTYLIHTPTKRSIHKTVSSKYTTRHSLKEIPLSCHRIKTLPFGKIHAKTIHSKRFPSNSFQIRLKRFGKISHLRDYAATDLNVCCTLFSCFCFRYLIE